MSEPVETMTLWQSTKFVRAGEITEVMEGGCYVRDAFGTSHFRAFEPGMTARYKPREGDFWVVYPGSNNYQAISPKEAFVTGYIPAQEK